MIYKIISRRKETKDYSRLRIDALKMFTSHCLEGLFQDYLKPQIRHHIQFLDVILVEEKDE